MAKQRLGQHFLFDGNMLRKLVSSMPLAGAEGILEIGPGRGPLTELLLGTGRPVTAVELDRVLAAYLRERFAGNSSFALVEADILDVDIPSLPVDVAVGNIPYYITTPIIFQLVDAPNIRAFGLLMQKEVARRIVAAHGSKEYGVLSVMCQVLTTPRYVVTVGRKCFSPPPEVDSAFVTFVKRDIPPGLADAVRRLVRTSFAMRRKTLANNLKAIDGLDVPSFLAAAGLDERIRPEQVPVATYVAMAEQLPGGRPVNGFLLK